MFPDKAHDPTVFDFNFDKKTVLPITLSTMACWLILQILLPLKQRETSKRPHRPSGNSCLCQRHQMPSTKGVYNHHILKESLLSEL